MSQSIVLLVDDDAEFRAVICSVLDGEDFQMLQAGDGLEAISVLETLQREKKLGNVAAVVSDLSMPKMNGVELLLKIRDTDAYKDLPFVLISGMVNQQEAMKLAVHAPDVILLKPFDVTTLVARIAEASKKPKK